MDIDKKELLQILDAVKPGLASKEIIEQTTSFIFTGDLVLTYNDEIAISHPCDLDLQGAIPAKEFYEILARMKADTVSITEGDGGELLIKSGRSKAGLKVESEVTMPLEEISKPRKWLKVPEGFTDSIKFCLFSAGSDMSKPYLTCLHIVDDIVESTDGSRATQHNMSGDFGAEVLLPATSANQLPKYEPTEFSIVPGWIHFRNKNDVIFSCRIIDGEYPDLDAVMEAEPEGSIKLPGTLTEILDRAGVFTADFSEGFEYVELVFSKGKLEIKGEGNMGWYNEDTRVKYTGEDFSIFVNPNLLRDMLKHIDEIKFNQSLIFFIGEDFKHAISLVVKS